MNPVHIIVPEEAHDERLDVFLSKVHDIGSRSRAALYIKEGLISINDKVITKPSHSVVKGEKIHITLPTQQPSHLQAANIPLEIIYEDDDVIVVNKPAGLVVHPAAGHAQDTMVNALLYMGKNLSAGFKETRPGIVHRIDKDTSGLLVVAKNDFSHRVLADQFQKKTVHRIYWAICFGKTTRKEGRMESFLSRHPKDRKRFASNTKSQGKWAVTNYRVLANYNDELALVELKLETGRTHQIRVHLSEMGLPIVSDWMYANKSRVKKMASMELRKMIDELPRFALHAAELGFKHPRSGKELMFKAGVPDTLKPIVEYCGFEKYL